jgi:hypothetical protein
MMFEPKPIYGNGYSHYLQADNYYAGEVNQFENEFCGKLAIKMKIGKYSTEKFEDYLNGRYPAGFESIQKKSQYGKKDKNGNERRARAGMEMNFAPPKSVSVNALLFDDIDCAIAHREASKEAMQFIENDLLYYRISVSKLDELQAQGIAVPPFTIVDTKAGMALVQATEGALWTAVTHTISRFNLANDCGGDPQMHDHDIMANHTMGIDGQMHTLEFGKIFDSQHLVGAVYMAALRHKLEKQGKVLVDTKHGFELAGYTRHDIKAFSDGRCQRIPEFINSENRARAEDASHPRFGQFLDIDNAEHRQFANNATRGAKFDFRSHSMDKQGKIDPALGLAAAQAWWTEKAKDSGVSTVELRLRIADAQRCEEKRGDVAPMGIQAEEAYALAVMHLTENSASIRNREEILRKAIELSNYSASQTALSDLIEQKIKDGELVIRNGGKILTTKQCIETEHAIALAYNQGRGSLTSIASNGLVDECLAQYLDEKGFKNLTKGQVAAAKGIVQSKNSVTIVVGDAGTGKSTSMELVKNIAEVSGHRIFGLAPSAKAKEALADSLVDKNSAKKARHANLADYKSDVITVQRAVLDETWWSKNITPGTFLIVDEAGLVGAEDMRKVLALAEKYKARVAIVGDPEQFKSVSAGSAMHFLVELARTHKADIRLAEMIRGRDNDTSELHYLARDNPEQAIISMFEKGRVTAIQDEQARLNYVADRYSEISEDARDNTYVITGKNSDRKLLNAAIRESLGFTKKTGIEFNSFERGNISTAELMLSSTYEIGDTIKFNVGNKPFKKGEGVEVVGKEGRLLIVERSIKEQDGVRKERIQFDPRKQSAGISLGNEERMTLCVGERVRFTASIGKTISNGDRGIVTELNLINRTAKICLTDSREMVDVDLGGHEGRGLSLRYGYAATGHASQGGTAKNKGEVIYHAPVDDGTINHNAFYTNMTRSVMGARGLQFVTDAKGADRVQALMQKAGTKAKQDRALIDIVVRRPRMENAFTDVGGFQRVVASSTGGMASIKKPLSQTLTEAHAKLGDKIGLMGSLPFKRKVVEMAEAKRLGITFQDKFSKSYQKQLRKVALEESARPAIGKKSETIDPPESMVGSGETAHVRKQAEMLTAVATKSVKVQKINLTLSIQDNGKLTMRPRP